MNRIRTDSLAGIAVLALATTSTASGGSMDKYFTKPEQKPRYYIAPEEGPLIGQQNMLLNSPEMLKPGRIGMRAEKVANVTATAFDLTTEGFGDSIAYHVELTQPDMAPKLAEFIKKVTEKKGKSLVAGMISKVADGGKSMTLAFDSEGEADLPCNLKLADRVSKKKRDNPFPDIPGRQYGPHAFQQFDVYYPKNRGKEPMPVMIFVHGGGWGALDKGIAASGAEMWTSMGMAYVSINYRFLPMNEDWPAVNPPVAAPLLDVMRCVQYLRYHAKELGLDNNRFCMMGGSAGGATSCWFAMHDDMADPNSDDPIARESTRLALSIPCQAQTSIDPKQMREWIPTIEYGAHAFIPRSKDADASGFEAWLAKRDSMLPWIKEFSAYGWASKDDPPMLLNYAGQPLNDPPVAGGNSTHSPLFGTHLRDRLKELGVEVWFRADNVKCENPRYDGATGNRNFVIDHFFGGKDPNPDALKGKKLIDVDPQ